jgi:membrane protein required for colicin V production
MNALDWVLLGLVALNAVRVAFRGLIAEVMAFAALVVGILAAILFYRPGAALLTAQFGLAFYPQPVAFLAILIIAFLVVKLIEAILKGALEAVKLQGIDKVLGFVLGLAEGVLLSCLILLLLRQVGTVDYLKKYLDVKPILDGSVVAKYLLPLIATVKI